MFIIEDNYSTFYEKQTTKNIGLKKYQQHIYFSCFDRFIYFHGFLFNETLNHYKDIYTMGSKGIYTFMGCLY